MPRSVDAVVLRTMTAADVPAVVDIQEPGAAVGLANVFPQDAYPFPRDDIARRWVQEIGTPGIDCFVVQGDGAVVGFAAIRGEEFLHFGIAIEHWGTGIAQAAHETVLDQMRRRGVPGAWLRVFTGNVRGRRFYEKLDWPPTGEHTWSTYPPYAELSRYERDLG
jgi:RimJ/RimL family protein N-acetyltransferase